MIYKTNLEGIFGTLVNIHIITLNKQSYMKRKYNYYIMYSKNIYIVIYYREPWCHRQQNMLTYTRIQPSITYNHTQSTTNNSFAGIRGDDEATAAKISNMEREISALQMEKRELKINYRELTLDYRELNAEYQKLINETSEATTSVKRGRHMFCWNIQNVNVNIGIFLPLIGLYIS